MRPAPPNPRQSLRTCLVADRTRLLILVMVAQPRHRLTVLLAAKRRVIQEVVGVQEEIEAARIGRIGVVDVLPIAYKHAQPRSLPRNGTLPLRLGERVVVWLIVVLGMRLVDGDMKVVVKLAAVRRQPRELPSHALLKALALRHRRARDHRERGVARGQVY